MARGLKKAASYILITLVIVVTVLTLLGIWDIIPIDFLFQKVALSLLTIFVAAVIVLFIFSVIIKDNNSQTPR